MAGPWRLGQVARQRPNAGRFDAGVYRGGLGCERFGQCVQPVHAIGLARGAAAIREVLGEQHLQQRQSASI
jgi:hypothetical protein